MSSEEKVLVPLESSDLDEVRGGLMLPSALAQPTEGKKEDTWPRELTQLSPFPNGGLN